MLEVIQRVQKLVYVKHFIIPERFSGSPFFKTKTGKSYLLCVHDDSIDRSTDWIFFRALLNNNTLGGVNFRGCRVRGKLSNSADSPNSMTATLPGPGT